MVKSLISQSLESKAIPLPLSPNYRSFQQLYSRLIAYADNLETYIQQGYGLNDIVYSIINLIANKAKVAPWGMYVVEDEGAYKQYQAMLRQNKWNKGQFQKIIELHHKALKPATNAGKWGDLMKYPNEVDTMPDFVGNGVIWGLLTGNTYILGRRLKAGANQGIPSDLRYLPPQYTDIICTDTFPSRATGYSVRYIPGTTWDVEDVAHINNFNPDYTINGGELYGVAPLKAAKMRLQKNNSLNKAEASSFDNEGIKALISMSGNPLVEETERDRAVETLGEMMRTQWSGVKNRGRIGISSLPVDVHTIGMTNEEMTFTESAMMDLRMLCNVFGGVPSRLLNDPENQAEANIEEAERALTTRCTLPHLIRFREKLNRYGANFWKMGKLVCDFEISAYTELGADAKEVAEWTSKLVAIIPDEQREQCGLAATGDPLMRELWVMQGGNRVPLSDFQANQVDAALNEEEDDPEESI